MKHPLLFCILLLPIATTHAMKITKASPLDEKIYTFFLDNKQTEAKNIFPHEQEKITSLFAHGITKNNVDFIRWILVTNKPLFDSPCVQQSFNFSRGYDRSEITHLLENYIETEKKKLQQELDMYAATERDKIRQHNQEKQLPSTTKTNWVTLKTTRTDWDNIIKDAKPISERSEIIPTPGAMDRTEECKGCIIL